MPTDRVHRLPQQAQPRTIRLHRPQPSTSDAATQLRHARPAPNERRYTRYVALHPLRRATPVTSQCTRSEEVQCLRIGCTASHNKPNRGQFVPTDPNRPPRTLRHSFDMLARLRTRGTTPVTSRYTRYVAKHPLRRDTPVTSRYTRYVATHPNRRGVMPTDRVHRLPQQAQPRTFPPDTPKRQHQTQPHNLEIPARLLTRGATPDPSRYTRYVAMHPIRRGVMPTDRV